MKDHYNDKTTYIKGITIILMFCNHLFPIPEWIYASNIYVSIPVGAKSLAAYIGGFGKICVSVFAFLTGVGLYYVYQRQNYNISYFYRLKYSFRKITNILVDYWSILFLFYIPIMFLFNVFNFTFKEIILNMFAINTSIIKVAWYVRFYLELMLSLPIIFLVLKKCNLFSKWIFLLTIIILHYVSFNLNILYLEEYFNYLMIVIFAYILEEKKVNEYLAFYFIDHKVLSIFTFFSIFVLRGLMKSVHLINTDMLFVPFYVAVVNSTYKYIKNNISIIISFLGKYSLELWFLHAIFFVGSESLQKICYWPKLDILILVWSFCILIPFAVLYNSLTSKICKVLDSLIVKDFPKRNEG